MVFRALTFTAGKQCFVWDCCVNPQIIRDAITHRTVKTVLIQTCLELVEQREDIVLSRQFALPKLTAKGKLLETKVPKEMFEKPATLPKTDEVVPLQQPGFFSGQQSIGSLIEQQRNEDISGSGDAVLPSAITEQQAKPKKPLIQEIQPNSSASPLSYRLLSNSPFSIFSIRGCSETAAASLDVSYQLSSHEVRVSTLDSKSTPLLIPVPEPHIPKSIQAVFNSSTSDLRIRLY